MHRRFFLLSLLAMPLSATAAEGDQKDLDQGRADALKDIAAGKLAWHNLGFPAIWRREFVRIMKEKYGVESKDVGDCEPNMPLARHTKAYNETMQAEIEKRFGKGVVDQAIADAKEEAKKNGL